jgi:hypothetical protein
MEAPTTATRDCPIFSNGEGNLGPTGTRCGYTCDGWDNFFCRNTLQIPISMILSTFWSSSYLTCGSGVRGKADPNWVRIFFFRLFSLYSIDNAVSSTWKTLLSLLIRYHHDCTPTTFPSTMAFSQSHYIFELEVAGTGSSCRYYLIIG